MSEPGFRGKYFQITHTTCIFLNIFVQDCRQAGKGSKGSKGGAVVRALASHQCGPGSNPGVDAICGLSLLLVLSFSPGGFSPGTPVFPSTQKPTPPNSESIWNARTRFNELIRTPKCAPWVSKLQKKKLTKKGNYYQKEAKYVGNFQTLIYKNRSKCMEPNSF